MPRKKSATKKAQENSGKPEKLENQEAIDHTTQPQNDSASGSESSDSEIEDDYGELLTENVEKLIQQVMETLKKDPKKLLDPNTKFFEDNDTAVERKAGDKPIYLKDYHRMNLLSGDYKNEPESEYGTVDGEKPYAMVEREERNKLLADINDAFEDEDEDDFIKKKEKSQAGPEEAPIPLPDLKAHPEDFLLSFLGNEAWIPKKNDKVIDLDEIDKDDEQDFDDAVEDFEKAFNFRYEDPNSAEIVSYARTQASLRRGKTNSRKRARDKKIALKEQEKHEIEQALQKKKTNKVNKVMDRLNKIKEAVGDDISDEVIERVFGDSLLNDDFDDADWDSRMAEIFNEQYYGSEITKPEWSDDDEIMAEFHALKEGKSEDVGEEDEPLGEQVESNVNEEDNASDQAQKPKSKKEKLKEKNLIKKDKKSLKEKAQKIVDANTLKIREEIEEERGRSKEGDVKFKYREVSPESFGLSTREIFLANDLDLNKLISIKKFAPYKPKDAALKDKRKFTKKKHLQQWRHEVFKNREGPARHENEKDDEIWIPNEDETEERSFKKSKKSSKK
ncbi:Krr1-domain-containing protein [Metschnikowia bicuspidata var. bicuspidata NRRL YB-4993]|uniref:Krr1-domain-containing protein n=1 Tax=Metschnikowia bicuspidata var. bicuspidata NRRL YB-4993 TaxID=869754 RepID=A0A1A0GZ73_9ASCO|nr:Krr1-domain-containing protein [Metschnikowia bicuspidata var. bicuspidata NRRL YB-4993]OBA16997.1 Krr1-domain-containing protein [Metschnikowia bicuspidata var. bicuspidata NRRL YB-4993]